MITCKEDFYKYYVEVNDREVFNKYCELAEQFGITFYNGNTAKSSADSGYSYISSHISNQPHNLFWCDKARLEGIYGKVKLTMTDLKPRTKVVYEQVEFNYAWELVKQFELHNDIFYKSSSTPTYERMSIENIQNMLRNEYPVSLYRKVEKEIDWREEVSDYFVEYEIADGSGEYRIDGDEFLDVYRVVLRATGELG